jgi:hypothetical protein
MATDIAVDCQGRFDGKHATLRAVWQPDGTLQIVLVGEEIQAGGVCVYVKYPDNEPLARYIEHRPGFKK